MTLYERQETLELTAPKKIAVVGCGGIGYWVAKFLAMSGCEYLELYDPDVLEESNGNNKADVTKQAILSLRDECTVYSYPFKFSDLSGSLDWIIDCTDDGKSQLENQEIAASMGAKYCKAGYDGEGFGIHNTVAEWGESTDGYTIVPSWVVPATIVAALTVAKVMKYPDKEVISSIPHLFKYDR